MNNETATARAERLARENYASHVTPLYRRAAEAPAEPTGDWPGGWVIDQPDGATGRPASLPCWRTKEDADEQQKAVGGRVRWTGVGHSWAGMPIILDREFWDDMDRRR